MANIAWIGVDDAARIIGVSPERVRQYCKQGRIRCKKVSQVWLIDQRGAELMADGWNRYPTGRPRRGDWHGGEEARGV